MTWREIYGAQNLEMANMMLKQQGNLNDAQARVKALENRLAEVRREWTAWNGRQVSAATIVREFDTEARAADWYINDSYFAEPYTASATWERIDTDPRDEGNHGA